MARGGLGGRSRFCGALGWWDVDDVQLAAGGWLDYGVSGRVVGYMVAVYDVLLVWSEPHPLGLRMGRWLAYVVPVSLPLLHCRARESECAFPTTRLFFVAR